MKNLFGFLVHILRKSSKVDQSSGSLSPGNLITATRNDRKKECQPSLSNRYSYVSIQPHVLQSTLKTKSYIRDWVQETRGPKDLFMDTALKLETDLAQSLVP